MKNILTLSLAVFLFSCTGEINFGLGSLEEKPAVEGESTEEKEENLTSASIDVSCDFRAGYDYGTATSLTKTISYDGEIHSVKWNISSNGKAASCGQLATGDYWIAPASGETQYCVDSVSNIGPNQDGLFVDDNPQLESLGLLPDRNGKDYGNYDASQTLSFPACYSGDVSLVAAVRSDSAAECGTGAIAGNCFRFIDVVTGLSDIPPTYGKDILRPAIDETVKTLINIETDMDLSSWPSDSRFYGFDSTDSISEASQRWRQTTEIFSMGSANGSFFSEGGRAFRSRFLTSDYGASKESKRNDDIFKLFSEEQEFSEKREAIASLMSYGQDIFCSVYTCGEDDFTSERRWKSGAGQWAGRGPSAALFAAFVKDPRYKNAMSSIPSLEMGVTGLGAYQEIEQINEGPNGYVWGDGGDTLTDDRQEQVLRYWGDHFGSICRVGNDENCPSEPLIGSASDISTGQRTSKDPHRFIDGPPEFPMLAYSAVTLGPVRSLAVQMKLIPLLEETINYPGVYQYVTRAHYVGTQTANDQCAPPDPREAANCEPYKVSQYTDKNCSHFGVHNRTGEVTWGPDPRDTTYNSCVPNSTTCTNDTPGDPSTWTCVSALPGDANYGQNGRFPDQHGITPQPVNLSYQAESIFEIVLPRE